MSAPDSKGLAESAFMRRVRSLTTACCYCGSTQHKTTECPWRQKK